MRKPNFYIISLKRNILPITFLIFTLLLVVFSKTNLNSAKDGLLLWATAVVPSLLPFFIATELLSYTNIINFIGKVLNKFMRPIFNVPGEGAFAFIIGMISGYPVGAKIVTKLRQDGLCTKSEGERMLSFTNNSGPLFILGTVGVTLFGNSTIGFLLLITHILACITVGILLGIIDRFNKKDTEDINKTVNNKNINNTVATNNKLTCSFSNLGEILGKSINNAISTVLMIGGFIVLFSVILSILQNSHIIDIFSNFISTIFKYLNIDTSLSSGFVTGIIELTNGVKITCTLNNKLISPNIILCAFLLGFGGFSILLQVLSITSKSDLSIKPYIIGKLMQGLFAAFYTYIAIKNIPFFNFDIETVFANYSNTIDYNISNISTIIYFFIAIILCLYVYIINKKNSKKKFIIKKSYGSKIRQKTF